jgi:hypothetical protein
MPKNSLIANIPGRSAPPCRFRHPPRAIAQEISMRLSPLARAAALAPFLGLGARAAPTPQPPAAAAQPAQPDASAAPVLPSAQPPVAPQPAATAGTNPPRRPASAALPGQLPRAEEQQPEEEEERAPGEEVAEEDEDEEDREEMRGTGPVTQARVRERARIAAILTHPAAAASPALAQQLAFGTHMGRHEAGRVLAAAGTAAPAQSQQSAASSAGHLSAAMAGFAGLRPGPSAPPSATGPKAIDASWDRARQRAGLSVEAVPGAGR